MANGIFHLGGLPMHIGGGVLYTSSIATATLAARSSTVLVGEIAVLSVSDDGVSVTDQSKKSVQWDFDDVGSTYSVGSGKSANVAYSAIAGKAWTTAGTKNVTCNIWNESDQQAQGTISITVQDPDTVTWDRDIYVTFSGNTTNFPTETGAVEWVENSTEYDALSFTTANQDVRITFVDDEVYNIGSTGATQFEGANSRYYITRDFNGTNPPQLEPQVGTAVFQCQRTNTGMNLIVYGIDLDGGYNAATGAGPRGRSQLVGGEAPGSVGPTNDISVFKCSAIGAGVMITSGGSSDHGPTYINGSDNYCTDWQDYAWGAFGGKHYSTLMGCKFRQNPRAVLRGAKDNKPGTDNQAADHAVRFASAQETACDANDIAVSNGWSSLGTDDAIQPAIRILPSEDETNGGVTTAFEAYVTNNELISGPTTLKIGDAHGSNYVTASNGIIHVNMNRLEGTRQGGQLNMVDLQPGNSGSVAFMNNLFFLMNVEQYPNYDGKAIFCGEDANPNLTGGTLYVGYNAFVSFQDEAGYDDVTGTGQISGLTVTKEHNTYYLPNHTSVSGYTQATPFSAGDDFQPVNDPGGDGVSAAHEAVTSGFYPHFDFNANVRSQTTNAGCHASSASTSTAVSAPSNSVVPGAPVVQAQFANEYILPDFGTWDANFNPYMIEYEWLSDGTPVTNAFMTQLDNSGGTYTGTTITCRLRATNYSGTITSVVSSGTAI